MATETRHAKRGQDPLHGALWVLQVLIAAAFLFFGGMKLTLGPEDVAGATGWAGSLGLLRFIGTSEVLGAIGLIVPSATRIVPRLTPVAALALATVVLLAAGVHMGRNEYPQMITPLVLAALLLVIWWGRDRARPIPPRSEG